MSRRVGGRRRLVGGGSFVALALSLLAPTEARAQPAPVSLSQTLRGESLAEYEGGRSLYREGDYAGALARFRRASEMSSDPRLLWDMAACQQKLGHIGKMMDLIDKYLATGGALLTDADRRLATRLENSVRARVSAVTVASNPDGVDVLIDDEPVGRTPIDEQPLWVDAGTHRVHYRKAGYKDVLRVEDVPGGGGTAWSVSLEHEAPPPPPAAPVQPSKPVAIDVNAGAGTTKPPSHLPPILLLGAGILQLGAGGVLVGLAASKFSQLRHDCSPACNPSSASPWPTLETVGDVLFVTGGLTVAGGVVWWVALPGSKSRTSALWVAPNVTPWGGSLTMGGML